MGGGASPPEDDSGGGISSHEDDSGDESLVRCDFVDGRDDTEDARARDLPYCRTMISGAALKQVSMVVYESELSRLDFPLPSSNGRFKQP